MRKTLINLGLDGSELQIRDTHPENGDVIASFSGAKLRELVEILEQLGEKIHITERRGLDFHELTRQRK